MKLFSYVLAVILGFALSSVLPAQSTGKVAASPSEEFFIISSLDEEKHQVVLKRPTEVTELMMVNEKTIYLDEQGKRLRFSDLRAGDTVYVMSSVHGVSPRLVTRLRRGPMTVEELHRRYLQFR